MFRKLPRSIRRLLRILGMAPEPPKIRGLFTALGRPAIRSFPIEDWYEIIRECTATSDCFVFEVGWYKNLGGKEEHEFLRFDILSPDEKHVAIVIAERGRGKHNLGDPNKTSGKVKRNRKRSARISSSFASSSSSQWGADDHVSWASRDSLAGDELKLKCEGVTRICRLTFTRTRPSAHELATLLHVTSRLEPVYNLHLTQCYWFADTIFEALKTLFEGAIQEPKTHRGGTWARVPIHTKGSVDAACAQYRATRVSLAEEVEAQRRLEQEVRFLLCLFTVHAYNDPNSKRKRGNENVNNVRLRRKLRSGNVSNVRRQKRMRRQPTKLRNGNVSNVRRQKRMRRQPGRLRRQPGRLRRQPTKLQNGNVSNARWQKRMQRQPTKLRNGNANNVRQQRQPT
ncbi:hypothetical protein BKA82DRAFT_948867 [Pisolithus tinctorius]|uniref:Uncharacterized protein n=1 Tax=Pisolithus tinctorius Marx 270 TaxID=870435 RepID=A0A0C3PCJ0_PISTI|nr:hypothetical protein BKA82DRAFT_948867 [Pisolithus tinctorius]KIO05434.1 hypothetical protein M404DRAFT_948867 [Pisolithus tinctorius Marx 270]